MKKIIKIVLVLAICMICVGCKNDEVEKDNLNTDVIQNDTINNEEKLNFQEELEKKEIDYIEGITDPVRIEETEEELRVNVQGNFISIYKCSGDIVTEWYEKYIFETNELAQTFVAEQENQLNISVKENIVVIDKEISDGIVMKKSDLVKTYSELKEVYQK